MPDEVWIWMGAPLTYSGMRVRCTGFLATISLSLSPVHLLLAKQTIHLTLISVSCCCPVALCLSLSLSSPSVLLCLPLLEPPLPLFHLFKYGDLLLCRLGSVVFSPQSSVTFIYYSVCPPIFSALWASYLLLPFPSMISPPSIFRSTVSQHLLILLKLRE